MIFLLCLPALLVLIVALWPEHEILDGDWRAAMRALRRAIKRKV